MTSNPIIRYDYHIFTVGTSQFSPSYSSTGQTSGRPTRLQAVTDQFKHVLAIKHVVRIVVDIFSLTLPTGSNGSVPSVFVMDPCLGYQRRVLSLFKIT